MFELNKDPNDKAQNEIFKLKVKKKFELLRISSKISSNFRQ